MLADVAVYGSNGQLQLVVEVKNRANVSTDWVSRIRRNLLVHKMLPNAPYFLLVLPDKLYLWENTSPIIQTPPNFTSSTSVIFSMATAHQVNLLDDISEYGLELLVSSWLEFIVHSDLDPTMSQDDLSWLFESGLYGAIKNGSVVAGVAVP